MSKKATLDPTTEQYGNLQRAYEYFNQRLFEGKLAHCMLLFGANKKNCMGYFHAKQWKRRGKGGECHTISLTPMYLDRSLKEIFATLVHEMVHLWQEDHGEHKSKNGDHNKEWGGMMKQVGLHPSNTGEEGGKETGQQMTHYIVDGGPFDAAFQKLPKEIELAWLGVQTLTEKKKSPKTKVCYECPGCELKVWGKPDIIVMCGECEEQLEPNM